MPWSETDAMKERTRFVLDYERGLYTMSELCRRYGVSRETGYKWWRRYEAAGLSGLEERSRRPKHCPHKTPRDVESLIVAMRRRHPSWGANLIIDTLARQKLDIRLPAPSTAGEILKRHGLVKPRQRRRKVRHPGRPYVEMSAPNDVWPADFKGEFKTRDGRYCYALTISDGFSRYLLACRGRHSTRFETAKPVFIEAFREYGLPRQILTDNGGPFASVGLAGLSRLSVWWIRLGIHPIRIEPGCPQQNPRHERMHRTLKADATVPPAANMAAQQRAFGRFRKIYNEERPHSSLEKRTPSEVYRSSDREYPETLPELEYPEQYEVRLVSSGGGIKWHDEYVFVGKAFAGERLGFEEVGDGVCSTYLGPVMVGKFDERELKIYG